MERNNIYVYIPRDKILNVKKPKYKKKEDIIKCFYYVKNKKFTVNNSQIQEIDIYNLKNIKKNCFYKNQYKSNSDPYFDYYCKIKPKWNNHDELFIMKNVKKDKLRLSYKKNVEQNRKKIRENNLKFAKKKLSFREKRQLMNPFTCYFD